MRLKDPKFDVIFAPYETYLDDVLGVKTSYGGAVMVRNEEESKKLAVFQKYVPDIQDALPLAAEDRPSKRGQPTPMDVNTAQDFLNYLDEVERSYERYQEFLDKGVAREIARIALPASVYTEWYWKIDLHNLFHFLSLRMDPHAQQEIRDYANAMFALIQPIVPIAAEAFVDYNFESLHLSRLEVEALRTGQPLKSENKRENAEWEQKKRKLGM